MRIALLLATMSLLAQPAPPAALTAHLQEALIIHADFSQVRTLAALSRPLKATGSLVLARDQGVIWQLRSPLAITYVMGPAGLLVVDGQGRRERKPVAQAGVVAQLGRIFQGLVQGDWQALDGFFTVTGEGRPERWSVQLAPKPQAAAGLEGVRLVDMAESVSALMGQYRRLGNAALAAAVLLVWGMLWRWREWRRGSLILAPSLLGMLAGLALAGAGLTLFKTIALVLVLGFGVDYTVFLAAAEDPAPALLGVLLAGFATLLSFGLLAFSHTPALRGFGLTLGLGLLVAVLSAPMALPRKEPT